MAEEIKDPREIGVSGLKGINLGTKTNAEEERAKFISSAKDIKINWRDNSVRKTGLQIRGPVENVGVEGWGTSRYDKRMTQLGELVDLNESRANIQPWYDKIGAGILKGTVLALTTFADGIAGTLIGAFNVLDNADEIENSDNPWRELGNQFINNPFSTLMQDINEKVESALPNYYTKAEQEDPWWEHIFSANFIGDKFLKNLGFTIGAAYSGKVSAGVISKAMGLKGVRDAFKGAVTTASGRTLNTSSEIARAYKSGDAFMDGVKLTDDLGRAAKQLKNAETTLKLVGSVNAAMGEGRIEAIGNSKEFENYHRQLLDDQYQKDLNNIEMLLYDEHPEWFSLIRVGNSETGIKYQRRLTSQEGLLEWQRRKEALDYKYNQSIEELAKLRASMANVDFALNSIMLSGSNIWQFGRFLSGGYNSGRLANGLIKGSIKEGFKFNKAASTGQVLRALSNPLVEANEEMMQSWFSESAGLQQASKLNSFYGAKINPEAEEETSGFLNSMVQGFSNIYGDIRNYEEGFIGGLTGMLGIPSISFKKNSGGKRRPSVSLSGELWEGIKEHRKDVNAAKALTEALNTRIKSPEFLNYYQGFIRHQAYQNEMDRALAEGDSFKFKNADFSQFVSDAIMFEKAGRIQDLQEIIEEAGNVTEDDVQDIRNLTVDKESGKSIFEGKTDQEVINHVRKQAEEAQNRLKLYSQISTDLKVLYGDSLDNDFLEEMTWTMANISDLENRFKSVLNGVREKGSDIIKEYHDKRYYGRNQDKRIGSLLDFTAEQLLTVLNREDVVKILESTAFIAEESEDKSLRNEQFVQDINDLLRIYKKRNSFIDSYELLSKHPEVFMEQVQKEIKEVVKKAEKKKSSDIKSRLAEARSPRDFRRIYREIENEGKVLSEDLERAVNELDEEGNAVVKENRNIQSLYQGAVAKLAEMGLGTSEMSDATTMLRNAMEDADNFAQMAEPTNQMYTQMGRFYNDENPAGSDNDANVKRFFGAQAAAYKALSQQLKEMGKNAESARFTTAGATDPKKGTEGPATTGDSGVSPAPAANPTPTPEPVEVFAEDSIAGVYTGGIEENQNKQGLNETAHTMSAQTEEAKDQEGVDPNRSWFPLSWFFIGARRLNGSLIPISDTEAIQKIDATVDFGQIPQWIEKTGAQRYVDSGNLKVGDKIVIGIPSGLIDRNGKPVLALYKVEEDKRIPVGIFTASGELAKKTRDKILSAYEKADKSKDFFSDITTTVNDVKAGYVKYGEQKSLSALDPEGDSILAVVSNGSVVPVKGSSSAGLSSSSFKRPANISEKNGMVYVAIPNARRGMSGGYSLIGVKVKKFNKKEYPLDSHSDASVVGAIRNTVEAIMVSKTQSELTEAVKRLSTFLYMPSLNFYLTKDNKVRVTITALDENGNKIKKKVKAADGTERLVDSERVYGTYSSTEELFNGLYALGPRFQVDKGLGVKTAIQSDTLLVNADSLETVGGWFTMNPVDETGSEVRGTRIPYSNPTPRETPASADNSLTVTVGGRQITLFSNGDYVSLATGQRKSPKDAATAERYRVIYNLQKQYGDATEGATMWNNKAVVGDRVIDRSTGEWVTGAAADEVRSHVNPEPAFPLIQTAQTNDLIFQNHDDMNPVEDLSENSRLPEGKIGYYFDSRDKRIHKTYMVPGGEILGTPVQVIKVPVMTSGLSSNGPKKLVGYNYGIVLPNGQSYIGTNINQTEFPVNAVFNGIKMSFEGPGSGPKGQEFVEKHKREFEELKSMPSIFPEQSPDPVNEMLNGVIEEVQETGEVPAGAEMDGMSFEDFAASMGADIGGVRLREEQGQTPTWNREKELKWLNKILPNVPVEVREGILHIAGKSAWGMFDKAGITLSNVAASGTAYHEAFHAVFSLGLTGTERVGLVREAMKESGLTDPVEVEEWLAERFREYVMNQQTKTVGQKIKDLFKKLLDLIRGIREAEPFRYTIYKRITSGRYRNIRPEPQAEIIAVFRPKEVQEDNSIFFDKSNNILLREVSEPINIPVNISINEETSEHTFTESIYRGTEHKPVIDSKGNLHLKPRYDSLSGLSTLSFADSFNSAFFYGKRYSQNPYIIEINKEYLDSAIPEKEYEKGKVGKELFRYKEEEGEVRMSIPEEVIIPKGQYNILHNTPKLLISNIKDILNLISTAHKYYDEANIADNMVFSEIDGRGSFSDYREIVASIDNFFGSIDGYRLSDILTVLDTYEHRGLPIVNNNLSRDIENRFLVAEEMPDGDYYYKLSDEVIAFINNKILEQQYVDAGYSKEWVRNSTPDEKRIARYCIGM